MFGLGCALAALLLSVACVVIFGRWSWDPWLVGDTVTLAAGLFAVAAASYAAVRRSGPLRRAYLLLGSTVLLNALGGILLVLRGPIPDAGAEGMSATEVLYLVAQLLAAAGIVGYPVTRGLRRAWRPLLLDGVVLAASLLLLGAVLGLSEVSARLSGLHALAALVYPVSDALLTSLVFVLLLRSVGGARLDAVLIVMAFACFTLADTGFALTSVRGDGPDALYQLGYVAAALSFALAALVAATFDTATRVLQRDPSGPLAPVVPDLVAIVAIAVCLMDNISGGAESVLVVVVLVVTCVRQVSLHAMNHGLRRELERQVADRSEELRQLSAEYTRLNGMKQEFVSAVSHELRTPLTAIRGSLEMLADGDAGELPPLARPVVEMAARGGERLARLVNDIIDVERLENGSFCIHPQPQDLHTLISDAVESLIPLALDAGVDLAAAPVHGMVLCDGDRVTQALVNLVGNAVKFTPPGGEVRVSAELRPGEVEVLVADTGRGIPQDELDAVFDRFHQVDPDDARQDAGSGLGLSITRGIVEAHGGRIWVVSSPRQGSMFQFTLPHSEVSDRRQARPSTRRVAEVRSGEQAQGA